MASRINNTGGIGLVNNGGANPFRRIQFNYARIFSDRNPLNFNAQRLLGIQRRFSLTTEDLGTFRRDLQQSELKKGAKVSLKCFGDKLGFEVVQVSPDAVNLDLAEIQHVNMSPMFFHTRAASIFIQLFSKRLMEDGLGIEVKLKGDEWTSITDPGQELDPLSFMVHYGSVKPGESYSIRVAGGDPVLRQRALLDFWFAVQAMDELDVQQFENTSRKKGEGRLPLKVSYVPDFLNIDDASKLEVRVVQSALPHVDKGEIAGFPGRLVHWQFHRDFKSVIRSGITEVKREELVDIFRRVITSYMDMASSEEVKARQQDWVKYRTTMSGFMAEILKRVGDDATISVQFLEGFFKEKEGQVTGHLKENVHMAVNYVVKGILGEDLENKVPNSKEPLILLTPSLTPREARMLPENVTMVLTSDMALNSHPEIILTERGVRLLRPVGAVADFIREPDIELKGSNNLAFVIVGNQKLWLNIGHPENLFQYLISVRGIMEQEQLQYLVLNGLERRIPDGDRVNIRISVSGGDMEQLRESFKIYMPDGIGLVRTEFIGNDPEEELYTKLMTLCDVSQVKVGSITVRLPVVWRLPDIGERRDNKTMEGIENPGGLTGSAFLLWQHRNQPEKSILKKHFRSALRAHLEKNDQIQIMAPFVLNKSEFMEMKAILQEVKEEMKMQSKEAGDQDKITDDLLRIPFGVMIENLEAAADSESLIRQSDFTSLGFNDLRDSFGKESLLDPDIVALLGRIIGQARKYSKGVSACGVLLNEAEYILCRAMGIRDFTHGDPSKVPEVSFKARAINQKELDSIRDQVLGAKTSDEIKQVIEAAQRHAGERILEDSVQMATLGYKLRHMEQQLRFERIRATKVKLLDKIMQIVRDDKPEKEQRIRKLLESVFSRESALFVEIPTMEGTSKWLKDDMLIVSYLDEWEIREALNKNCRGTPYIFSRSPADGSFWARTIPREGDAGTMSRYSVMDLGETLLPNGDAVHLVEMNYFDPVKKSTSKKGCLLVPIAGFNDRYEVTVSYEDGQKETVQLLLKEENGKKFFYRRVQSEKLFIAKVLNRELAIPPDSSILKEQRGELTSIFIGDRYRLSQIESIQSSVDDIERSIERDIGNTYYQPDDPQMANPFIVNQLLFVVRTLLDGSKYVIAVDNWRQNREGFTPLIDEPSYFSSFVEFIGSEFEQEKVLLEVIGEREKCSAEKKELLEKMARTQEMRNKLRDSLLSLLSVT